jgi:hypothetical protein
MMQLLASLHPEELTAIVIVTVSVIGVVAVTLPIVFAVQLRCMRESRINAELKREMLARGLSAEDIALVIGTGTGNHEPEGAIPSAGEIVVEHSGEWHSAILLKRSDSRWFIHYVGTDSDQNEWVTADRIRFPLAFFEAGDFDMPIRLEKRPGRESHAGYYAKPVPADHDLS